MAAYFGSRCCGGGVSSGEISVAKDLLRALFARIPIWRQDKTDVNNLCYVISTLEACRREAMRA
jgi:hypothetical protein